MRVIFLLLLSSIAFQSKSQTWNNYLQKRFKSYGIWADSVLLVPNDTSLNKTGFAIKGSTAYIGDGVKWTAITGGSSVVDSLVYATKANVIKVRDSLLAADNFLSGVNTFLNTLNVSNDLQLGAANASYGNAIFYNANNSNKVQIFSSDTLATDVDIELPTSSGKLALTTDIAIVDTSIISTKAYVNYKDDIQQGFIDMRKLDADSIAWTGYATRARLQQQMDSARAAQQAMIHDTINNLNRLKAGTSAGVQLLSNSGATVAEFGLGGGTNFDFHGFAGYDANRSASYTDRSFTDKKYVDSTALLLARLAAVNIFTTRNTFNGALFGNKDSIQISTTNQWILAIDTVTGAITRINRIAAFVPNADTTISTNYTLTQRDLGRSIYCTNTSLITITIPTGLTTGITLFQDRRYNIGVYQEGTGNGLVQFAASGTTIQSTEGALKTRVANSYAEIKFKSDTVIKLVGDII